MLGDGRQRRGDGHPRLPVTIRSRSNVAATAPRRAGRKPARLRQDRSRERGACRPSPAGRARRHGSGRGRSPSERTLRRSEARRARAARSALGAGGRREAVTDSVHHPDDLLDRRWIGRVPPFVGYVDGALLFELSGRAARRPASNRTAAFSCPRKGDPSRAKVIRSQASESRSASYWIQSSAEVLTGRLNGQEGGVLVRVSMLRGCGTSGCRAVPRPVLLRVAGAEVCDVVGD